MAYWTYRLYSRRDSTGEFLEGKDTIFGEIRQSFGKRNHIGLWEKFSTHLKTDIQEVLGYFSWRLLGKEWVGDGKRKDLSTPYEGSRTFL